MCVGVYEHCEKAVRMTQGQLWNGRSEAYATDMNRETMSVLSTFHSVIKLKVWGLPLATNYKIILFSLYVGSNMANWTKKKFTK